MVPAVRNSGTPAESLRLGELDRMADLLGQIVGLQPWVSDHDDSVRQVPRRSSGLTDIKGDSLERTVESLVAIGGVSGHEDRVRQRIQELVPEALKSAVRVDRKGNLIVRLGVGNHVSAAFIAHMDEIGLEVQSIRPSGSVSVATRGGGRPDLFAWQPAEAHGSYGTLPAVMSGRGQIEFGGLKGDQIRELGVRVGDSATVPKRFRRLIGSRIAGRSLDDRLGCAVLLGVLRRLAGRTRRSKTTLEFVFSVQEETGLHGARHHAENSQPKLVYPIDTFVTSDSPFGPDHLARARLGGGAVLRAVDESGMTPVREVERVAALARRHGIPLQYGVTAGGNDGSVFASLDTTNIPIGFPLRYAHTPVETADLRDARAVAELVEALALEELRAPR